MKKPITKTPKNLFSRFFVSQKSKGFFKMLEKNYGGCKEIPLQTKVRGVSCVRE